MPMKSKAQRAFLHANKPGLAKEFESKTKKGAKLPEKVGQRKKPSGATGSGKKIKRPKRDRNRT